MAEQWKLCKFDTLVFWRQSDFWLYIYSSYIFVVLWTIIVWLYSFLANSSAFPVRQIPEGLF